MIRRKTILMGALLLSLPFLSAYDDGVAEHQNKDRTGAPGADASCNVSCHTGTSFNPTIELDVLDMNSGMAISEYIPGETYELQYTITAGMGTPGSYGFQSTVLIDTDNSNAGSFENPGMDVQIEDVDGRHILEHHVDSPSNVFTAEWTAPLDGSGDVTFYCTAIAANNNGANSGDGFDDGQWTLTEMTVGVDDQAQGQMEMYLLNRDLYITTDALGQLDIFGLNGQIIRSQQVLQGSEVISLSDFEKGIYIVGFTQDGKRTTQKIMVM